MPENIEQPTAAPVQAGEAGRPTIQPVAEAIGARPGVARAEQPTAAARETLTHWPIDRRVIRDMPPIRSQVEWQMMDTFAIGRAIESGKIDDPRALLTLVEKEYEEALQRTGDADRTVLEARYRPLIEGDRQALAQYCLEKAQPHLDYVHNRAEVDLAFYKAHPNQTDFNVSYSIQAGLENYQEAARWQELAARITAEKEGALQPQPEEEAKKLMEESRITSEQHRTLGYLRDHPTQLDALSSLRHLDANGLQTLMDMLNQMKVKEELAVETAPETEGTPTTRKTEKAPFLLDLLLALIQGVKDGIVSSATEKEQRG